MRNALPILLLPLLALVGCMNKVHDIPPTQGGQFTEEVSESWVGGDEDMDEKTEVAPPVGKRVDKTPKPPQFHFPAYTRNVKRNFAQGQNPTSDSKMTITPEGKVEVKTGSAAPNAVTIPPAPDYTKYFALVMSVVMIGAGAYMLSCGWERIGTRFVVYGSAGFIISLTVSDYGWLYALIVLAAGLYICYEKYKAYKIGLYQPVPKDAS